MSWTPTPSDPRRSGPADCAHRSDSVDGWLAELFDRALEGRPAKGLCLLAVGGYGRAELCPESDIDVLLLHGGQRDIGEIANALWYPIWDAKLKLGHSVRTEREALTLAETDLDTATSLLSARVLAGDEAAGGDLARKAAESWRKQSRKLLPALSVSVAERHARCGEVAFLLEPDLKDGRGGLRDVHSLSWAERARTVLDQGDEHALREAYDCLLTARVALHRRLGRPKDVLTLDEQDGVADDCGYASADELMGAIAAAARTIAWISDEGWDRLAPDMRGPLARFGRKEKQVGDDLVVRDGWVHLAPAARVGDDATLPLRAATVAAEAGGRIDRASLERLEGCPTPDEPWSTEVRQGLVDFLSTGPSMLRVSEALDQRGLLVRYLPEWAAVRSKPQRNAYHTYTVDRHLLQTVVNASSLVDRVSRPDLLVLGALLHDIGKGYPGDHTIVGMDLVVGIGARMGLPAADVAVLVDMVRHHLLLPDVATRRDLSDESTITNVADAVGDRLRLDLLWALTEADSLATGPAAWNTWKADLVAELVRRAGLVLDGDETPSAVVDAFPSEALRARVSSCVGQTVIEGRGSTLTVIAPDRPGLLAGVAGVLALAGLDVLEANVGSHDGMAIEEVLVASQFGDPDWARVQADLERVLAGKLALEARLAERARTYAHRRLPTVHPVDTQVKIDPDGSATATVIDVRCPDRIGLLYRITRAFGEMHLDIRHAKLTSIGPEAVDAFYVVGADGLPVTDPAHLVEIELAVLHALR